MHLASGARKRSRAICAAFVAIVVAACTLIGEWHDATVLHARCADHGELYDVTGAGPKVGDHQIAASNGLRGDEHAHCAMSPREHEQAPAHASPVRVAMPPVAPAPLLAPRMIAAAPPRPLRHAPKTSPPVELSSVW